MKHAAWLAVLILIATVVATTLRAGAWSSMGGRSKTSRIDLMHLGSIELSDGFQLLGMADVGDRPSAYTLQKIVAPEFIEDRVAATFLFEKDPSVDWGGYVRDPVLLTLTLYDPLAHAIDPAAMLAFRVHRYYSPVEGETIPVDSPRWQSASEAALSWRWLEMDDDTETRWAVVLIDPARRLRLDFFVWKKKYDLDEARALLRAAAESVRVTPALAEHFQRAASYEERMAAGAEQRLAEVEKALAPLGSRRLQPGEPVVTALGAALLDRERRTVTVARTLGALPLAADTKRGPHARPTIPLTLQPGQYVAGRGTVDGLPNLEITVLYWDGGAGRWRASEVQTRTAREDEALPPLLAWIAERLTDRESAHLLRVGAFRLAPTERDPIPLPDFLHSAQVYETDLAAGRIIAGKVAASR